MLPPSPCMCRLSPTGRFASLFVLFVTFFVSFLLVSLLFRTCPCGRVAQFDCGTAVCVQPLCLNAEKLLRVPVELSCVKRALVPASVSHQSFPESAGFKQAMASAWIQSLLTCATPLPLLNPPKGGSMREGDIGRCWHNQCTPGCAINFPSLNLTTRGCPDVSLSNACRGACPRQCPARLMRQATPVPRSGALRAYGMPSFPSHHASTQHVRM